MAEFTEVCRQAIRWAKTIEDPNSPAERVSLCISMNGRVVKCSDGVAADTPEEMEARIMQWATEHPEPRYPTWHEAWKQLFPNGQGSPCPATYDMKYALEQCGETCYGCKNRPIPADIAEKLNIKETNK